MSQRPKAKETVLIMDPSDAITFRGDFTSKVSKASLNLKNPTEFLVAFKVKTTAPRRYCVRPNSGTIQGGQTNTVNIMLQPNPSNDDLSKHKFMLQTIILESEDHPQLEELFKTTASGNIASKKLVCKFESVTDDDNIDVIPIDQPPNYQEQVTVEQKQEPVVQKIVQPVVKETVQVVENVKNEAAEIVAENVEEIAKLSSIRPKISAVPTEPVLVNPVEGAAKKLETFHTTRVEHTKVESVKVDGGVVKKNEAVGNFTTIKNEELSKLKNKISALTNQLDNMKNSASMASITQSSADNTTTFWKAIIIIGIMSFILGWMISSMLCNC